MSITADQSSIKLINCKAIVETLIGNGSMSKSSLSRELKLSKPSVTENVNVLKNLGLIHEVGQGDANSKGGRKPTMLEFNKQFKYIVAIDFNSFNPLFAIGDLNFNLLHEKRLIISKNASSHERIEASIRTIAELLRESNITSNKLGAIVISSPGLIGENSYDFYANPQFRLWTNINLAKHLENAFNVKVITKNDVNLAVIGEHTIGHKKKYENIVYVSLGMGVGAGIVLNHKLYEGKRYSAGEIGYFTDFKKHLEKRRLEDVISIDALVQRVRKDLKNSKILSLITSYVNEIDNIEFSHIVKAYNSNDTYIKNIIYEVGLEIGYVINNIAALLDIDLVLIGGEYLIFESEILKGINEIIKGLYLFKPILSTSSLKKEASVYGAFVVGFDYIFDEISKDI